MVFNKARAMQEAEALASQGRISQAIDRYFRIFEKDPSELILLNTIGDLYIRDKNVPEGLKQFYTLAEAYVQGGFILKAIAIYKKIVKLEPDSVGPLLKLGELYQAQRLVRETRELYYQIAEFYKKKKQNDKALETLRKVVQLDAENPTARARLAAFCEEMGRKDEAAQVYLESAQLALRRDDPGAVEVALNKAQELIPRAPQVRLIRARLALARKHPEDAQAILSAAPELKDDPAARPLLIETYVALRQLKKAETLALELARAIPPDISALACFVSACVQAGQVDAASRTLSEVASQLIAQGNTSALMESLRLIQSKSPQHLPALELIFRICNESGDVEALPGILEALGHAYLLCGQFEKAKQAFQRLIDREPTNEHYDVLLRDVLQKQAEKFGEAPEFDLPPSALDIPQEEDLVPPVSAPSPVPVTNREGMVREALENSELFARYHLLSRAVAELDKVLEVYPEEIEIHKRLVGMCWKDMPERAEQAAQALALIYAQQGDAEGARRFAQMAREPEAVAALAVRAQMPKPEPPPPIPPQPAASVASEIDLAAEIPSAPVQEGQQISADSGLPPGTTSPATSQSPLDTATLVPSAFPPASHFESQAIDLSEDLEAFLSRKGKAAPAAETLQQTPSFNYEDSRIEISFYLENGFFEEAKAAVQVLEKTIAGDPRVTELRSLVEAYAGGVASEASREHPATVPAQAPAEAAAPAGEEIVDWREPESRAAAPPEGQPLASPPIFKPPLEAPSGAGVAPPDNFLGDFTEAFESAMGKLEAQSTAPVFPTGAVQPVVPAPQPGDQNEGRAGSDEGVQEPGSEDDAEAHFNLGVAFWEMKHVDEAIGEFQKVVNGAETNSQPGNYLQACSLLAACFMEKGMTTTAIRWYCRALETPHLDQETWLALHYDLGVAYEQTGDLPRALEMFSEVYGQRIDFRDVAEKIRAYQQKGS